MKKHDLKDDIGYWLSRLRMQVHEAFKARLAVYDVTVAQWRLLLVLYNKDASSITDLSKFIEIDKASISRVLDRLLLKELVIHEQGEDRRSGYIQLTQKALDLVPHLIQAAEENERHFFSCLSPVENEQLQQIFRKLFQHLPSIHLSGWLSSSLIKETHHA